jgi:hypothetical protein
MHENQTANLPLLLQQNSFSGAVKNQKTLTSIAPGTSNTNSNAVNDVLTTIVEDEEKNSAELESSSATETSQSVFSGENTCFGD